MNENWDFLIAEFRRLGGIADNVTQKEGEYGRGIFSVDPNLKVRIFTPSKLLVNKDHIYLEDNKLRIKKDNSIIKKSEIFLIFTKIIFLGDLVVKKQQNYLRRD